MKRPLSARRRIESSTNGWSSGVQSFISNPIRLDHLVKDDLEYQIEEQRATKVRSATPHTERSRYEVTRKAFQVSQRHRASMIQKYQNQLDRTQTQSRKSEDAARPKDPSKVHVKQFRDRHVLEHVIAKRNDEYLEAAEYIPQGYVPDLKSMRKLPPDRKFKTREPTRVFYWG